MAEAVADIRRVQSAHAEIRVKPEQSRFPKHHRRGVLLAESADESVSASCARYANEVAESCFLFWNFASTRPGLFSADGGTRDTGRERVMDQFMSRDAIEAWVDELGLDIVKVAGGDETAVAFTVLSRVFACCRRTKSRSIE